MNKAKTESDMSDVLYEEARDLAMLEKMEPRCPWCGNFYENPDPFCSEACQDSYLDEHAEHDDDIPGNSPVEESVRERFGVLPVDFMRAVAGRDGDNGNGNGDHSPIKPLDSVADITARVDALIAEMHEMMAMATRVR